MIGAGCAPTAASQCRPPTSLKRSARSRPWSTRTSCKYSLDAICQRYGLPGKDETLLSRKHARPPACKISKKINATQAHLATAGAICRPLRRDRRGANARSVRETHADHRAGRHARGLSARSRPDADDASQCAAAASASIRTPPNRVTIEFIAKRDAALKELSDQHGALVGMDEINSPKWKVATFERYGIISPRKTPKKARLRLRPEIRDGWEAMNTGCRG